MSKDLKTLSQRFVDEVINAGNPDRIEEFLAPDWVDLSAFPGQEQGIEGAKQRLAMIRSAFPDYSLTIEEAYSEGDTVVQRVTGRGTHRGDWMGFPPSGKTFEVEGIEILKFRDGKEVSHRVLIDQMSMMMQLGLFAGSTG